MPMRDSLRTYLSAELVFYYVLTTAILFGFWQGASWLVQADYLPSPLKVVPRLIEMLGNAELWLALLASLQRLVISFVCALAGGIVVGLAIGRSTLARGLIEPLLALSYP